MTTYIFIILIALLFIKIIAKGFKMNKFAKEYKKEQLFENLKK